MRSLLALAFALLIAAACVRLGVWQLDRLEQRRALNALVASRLRAEPVSPAELPLDTGALRYRRVAVGGRFDFEHEVVLPGRTREGSPGVNILTPLRPDDGGRAVLVNRGWVYSPDASTVDLGRWRESGQGEGKGGGEGEQITVEGYVEPLAPPGASAPLLRRAPDSAQVARAVPYPVAPYVIAATSIAFPSAASPTPSANAPRDAGVRDAPVRLLSPSLDEGPHRGYAFQWFSFAAIAIVGVPVLLWHEVRRKRKT
ncbi:MAG: SURF1 family protein [Gemmatimonadaceae bacterium]